MKTLSVLLLSAALVAGAGEITSAVAQTASGSPGANAASPAKTNDGAVSSGANTSNTSTDRSANLPAAAMGETDASGGVNDTSVNPKPAQSGKSDTGKSLNDTGANVNSGPGRTGGAGR